MDGLVRFQVREDEVTVRMLHAIAIGVALTISLIAQTAATIEKAFELFQAQKYDAATNQGRLLAHRTIMLNPES